MSNVIKFPGSGTDDQPGENQALETEPYESHGKELEVLEGTVMPAAPARRIRPVSEFSISRPTWEGTKTRTRQGVKWSGKAVLWALFTAIPTGAWLLIRWFFIGMCRWPAFISYLAAMKEREDLMEVPHSIRSGRGGARIKMGASADQRAVRRTSVFLAFHGVLAYVIGTQLGTGRWFLLVAAPAVVATIIRGCQLDVKPVPAMPMPTARRDVTALALTNALRSPKIGILPKPTSTNMTPKGVRQSWIPQDVGIGKQTWWELPEDCGASARDVVAQRERLASVFKTDLERLLVEVGRHSGEFVIWTSEHRPFDPRNRPEHPLLKVERFSCWERSPFGRDIRHRIITHPLLFVSWLIGARPRRGKSFAARSLLTGAVLDPYVKWTVFCGKYGDTWGDAKPLCEPGQYVVGEDDDDVKAVAEALKKLVEVMRDRHKRIKGSKLTREQTQDPTSGLAIHVVLIDEAQTYINHREYGAEIVESLVILCQVGPSAGFVPVIITQRPDSESFPTVLRAAMGARFCLSVMSFQDSNIVLGPDMSKNGYDASQIPARLKGVGYLRPDDDGEEGPDEFDTCLLVQTFDMDDPIWAAVCAQGVRLREQLTLERRALEGPEDELLSASTLLERIRTLAPVEVRRQPWARDVQSLGNWLGGVGGGPKVSTERIPGGNGRMGRSRRAVEQALELPPGTLALGYPEGAPHGDPEGPPVGVPEGPPDLD